MIAYNKGTDFKCTGFHQFLPELPSWPAFLPPSTPPGSTPWAQPARPAGAIRLCQVRPGCLRRRTSRVEGWRGGGSGGLRLPGPWRGAGRPRRAALFTCAGRGGARALHATGSAPGTPWDPPSWASGGTQPSSSVTPLGYSEASPTPPKGRLAACLRAVAPSLSLPRPALRDVRFIGFQERSLGEIVQKYKHRIGLWKGRL